MTKPANISSYPLAITSTTVGLISPPAAFCDSKRPGWICIAKANSRKRHGNDINSKEVQIALTGFFRYQCLGNHDIVPGQSGVDFQTKVAPLYDDRWFFVCVS
jgi:hypothetical protein